MGARGPGAARLRKAARRPGSNKVHHPWAKKGMPAADQVLAFLRTLPIVSGLLAGTKMELIEFQEQFVRGVYAETEGERLVRLRALTLHEISVITSHPAYQATTVEARSASDTLDLLRLRLEVYR